MTNQEPAENSVSPTKKDWMTLNRHGKKCLASYLNALSANDVMTTELDYLNRKGLTDYKTKYPDYKKRMPVSIECFTDIGIATAKHYFPRHFY